MPSISFGNHASVLVPQCDRASVRRFYCDVLGGTVVKEDPERDFVRLGEDFFIGFLYGDVPDESVFLRSARAIWLELKTDDVEGMSRRILDSGLVRKLEVPDAHLYFQAPGGQCLRLVGVNEDMSFYEGGGAGPNVSKVKEAIGKLVS
jgi:catechol 2,3-dioxygenase-like lactoylglutathione lyase family enzyme